MTSYIPTKYKAGSNVYRAVSDIVAVATTITLNNFPIEPAHFFASIEFYSTEDGTLATPSAGTVVITAKTYANPNVSESITDGTITASSAGTVNWAGNTKAIIATPDSIAGATHMRLRVTANVS